MDARVQTPARLRPRDERHDRRPRRRRRRAGASATRVTVMPLDWDGTCPACLAGNQHICQNLDFIGIDSPGALQELLERAGRARSSRCPTASRSMHAALVEPVAVAVHDVRRSELVAGREGRRHRRRARSACSSPPSPARFGAEVVVIELDADAPRADRGPRLRRRSTRATIDQVAWVERVDRRRRRRRRLRGLGRRRGRARRDRAREGARHDRRRRHPPDAARDRPAARVLARAAHPRRPRLPAHGLRDAPSSSSPTASSPPTLLITAIVPLAETQAAFADLEAGRAMKILVDVQAGQEAAHEPRST